MTRIDATSRPRNVAKGSGWILAITAAYLALVMTGCKSPQDGQLPGGEPVVIGLNVTPATVTVGGRTAINVVLNMSAPEGGQVVQLTYSNPDVLVNPPATLGVAALKSTGTTGLIMTQLGPSNQIETCKITAQIGSGDSKSRDLTVKPKPTK